MKYEVFTNSLIKYNIMSNKLILCLIFFSFFSVNALIAQKNNKSDKNISQERILEQKSYHVDLPTYKKAKLIIDKLIEETSLSELEIIELLDIMVADPTTVEKQILIRFYGLPVFVDTGNPELDNENYKKAKNDWIKKNPEKYNNLINSKHTQK